MDKTALVTGGTTRLGKVIAEALRTRGWRVLTTSHRADSGADIVADFSTRTGVIGAYSAAIKLLDGEVPDALVNNAALYQGDEATLMAVDFEAPRTLTMLMGGRENGIGAVVNIIDAAIDNPLSAAPKAYREAKKRLREETRMAAEMFALTLRVNAVSPGPIAELAPTNLQEKAGVCPHGRPTAAAVAGAVVFLLENDFISGEELFIDGGMHLAEGSL